MERILVDTKDKLDDLTERLRETDVFAYDTETNGTLDRFKVQLVGASFAGPDEIFEDRAYYVPVLHEEGEQLLPGVLLESIRPIMASKSIEKVCHNAKFDEMVLYRHGLDVQGFGHDTMVMSWLLAEDMARGTKGLKPLTKSVFGVDMTTYEDVISAAPKQRGVDRDYNFARVPLSEALDYAADDAYWCWRLYDKFKPELIKQKLWDAYRHIEGPFTRVLRKMEEEGVSVDLEAIDAADERLPQIMEEVEAQIYKEAGEVFNIGSGKQLGPILYEKMGIGKNVPKTDSGNYKTDKKTLATYAGKHEIVANVLRRKKIQKTHGTFVEGIKKYIGPDGKVHPNFNGTGTVTGRLSGSHPNLQQIEADEVEEIKVRDFFVPSEGNVLVVGDYSQIELRMMAHFSKDKYMIDSFLSGKDFHDETARGMLHVEGDVSRRQRVIAKTLNFGVGYGRGPKGIAEQLGCSQEEAQNFINGWFQAFPGVKAYIHHVHFQARKQGYIRTLSGRKRRLLPDIRSDNWFTRGRAERQAFNTKIQGSAADIIKMAMNSMHEPLLDYNAHLIIQIHDELVIDCPREYADECVVTMKEIMENPLNGKNPLRLPLKTDPAVVESWGKAK